MKTSSVAEGATFEVAVIVLIGAISLLTVKGEVE